MVPIQNAKVKISKAYATYFGSFKDHTSFYDYSVAQGGANANFVAMRHQMAEKCGLQGKKWGISADGHRVWVKSGCKGAFSVLYDPSR